ncbi:SLC13 family permease [Rhizobium sp. SSA_523]|uniref:SLC13 family permease n=1 Tax=Rhizobium sp. SSA_523 TaxID=2952477 RepID=UPI002090C60E|nr:SLC13 family permease [Rhizobium sp. SSA_523]MCO5732139.1 SLC13 family permease [Rhizobium sp. SSA_523]WKC25619.1 SLC13 family permease [Rhizobium sp. SSA_523]
MTLSQILIIGLLAVLLAAFASDRFRAESVAIAGLVAGTVLGLVPADRVFSGLTNPAVITVVEVLLIVHALARSHIFDRLGEILNRRFTEPRTKIMALCGLAACLSSVMNNVAAFSLMLPACFSLMARGRMPVRWIFLPLSYATLLGGLWTTIGTPANLVASTFLQRAGLAGFSLLDFAPVGILATAAGLLILAYWLPRTLMAEDAPEAEADSLALSRVSTELQIQSFDDPAPSVAALEASLGGRIFNIIRDGRRLFPLRPETAIGPSDRLLVEADPKALERALAAGAVSYFRKAASGERRRISAVVMPHSLLAGSSIAAQDLSDDRGVEILQVEGEPLRYDGPFEEVTFKVGSILLLEGDEAAIHAFIAYHELVEIAENRTAANPVVGRMPLAIFAAGVVAAACGLLAPELALGGVVAFLTLTGKLDIRSALRNLNWPILVILAAMLPLGEAVGTTGAASAIASAMADHLPLSNAAIAVFSLLSIAMVITPFVNNATTVAILAPIAIEIAQSTQLSPQMLVMAVAVGASCDFLTPFGHHNNTLAYGLGQYRFRDFLKLGWPVALASVSTAGLVLLLYWQGLA